MSKPPRYVVGCWSKILATFQSERSAEAWAERFNSLLMQRGFGVRAVVGELPPPGTPRFAVLERIGSPGLSLIWRVLSLNSWKSEAEAEAQVWRNDGLEVEVVRIPR